MSEQDKSPIVQGQTGQFTNVGGLATVVINKRQFSVYLIEDNELDTLKDGYSSLSLTFLGIAIGAAISLGPAFAVLPKGDWLRPWLGVGFLAALILGIYFGNCVYKDHERCSGRVAKIRATEVKTEVRFIVPESETVATTKP